MKKPFEKSKRDVEPKGMREGSKKEERLDAAQKKTSKKPMPKPFGRTRGC